MSRMKNDSATPPTGEHQAAEPVACSIVSNNYLPFVRVLAASFFRHHPHGRFVTLVVDRPHPRIAYEDEAFEVIFAEDLGIPGFLNLAFRYSIVELNTAVKPYLLAYLHEVCGAKSACYFDPDILITASLGPLFQELDQVDAVLTPHILEPLEDRASPEDRDFLLTGTFNLGFVGFRFTTASLGFLSWWQRKLYDECLHEVERGLFVDQRWMDLAPSFLPSVSILRDPGYNVAYWNLAHRELHRLGEDWRVDGSPLYFFHFSGFDPGATERVSKYQNRIRLSERPDVAPLFAQYRDQLLASGYEDLGSLPYAYGFFSNGVPIPVAARRGLASDDPTYCSWSDPFEVESAGEGRAAEVPSFFDWLRSDGAEVGGVGLPRVCRHVWDLRPDAQTAFPRPEAESLVAYARWFMAQGAKEAGIPRILFQGLEQSLLRMDAEREDWFAGRVGQFANGARIPPRIRESLAGLDPSGARWPRPAATTVPNSFFSWLQAAALERPLRVSNLALMIWQQRHDLQAAFPDLGAPGAEGFADWMRDYGRDEEFLDDVFLRDLLRSADEMRRLRLRDLLAQASTAPPAWDSLADRDRKWLTAEASWDDETSFIPDPNPAIPRLALLIHESRRDLAQAFPEPLRASRSDFAYWYLGAGRAEYRLPRDFVAPVERSSSLRVRWSARLRWLRLLAKGRPTFSMAEPAKDLAGEMPVSSGSRNEDLNVLHNTWETLAQTDPLWAILSEDDKRHGRWDLDEFFATGRQEVDEILKELAGLDLTPAIDAALDFGCGAGRLTRGMARHFQRVVGVDISETMVELARGHCTEDNISYVHNTADHLGIFPDNTFSFVYTGRVLQHIRPDLARNYIREFFRILAPGGVAVFQAPGEIRGGDASLSALAEDAYQAELEILGAPERVAAGDSFEVRVRVTNASPRTWPSVETLGIFQIRLANQWLDEHGAALVTDDGRTALREPVGPGESRELRLIASAPTKLGKHTYRLDLVQEFIAWFSHHSSQTAERTIEVVAPRAAASRANESSSAAHAGIEMHVISRNDVEELIEESGGELVAVENDTLAGPEWVSLSYRARKSQRTDPYLQLGPPAVTGPLRGLRGVRSRPWGALLEPSPVTDSRRKLGLAAPPLNSYLAALWWSNRYLQQEFPLDSERERYRFLYWLHLANGRTVDLQQWLLPEIDWHWFRRPAEGLAPGTQESFTNFEWLIWGLRRDFQEAYPLDQLLGRRAYRERLESSIASDYAFELQRIETRFREAGTDDRTPRIPSALGRFDAGINVIEHPLATLGIREDARTMRLAFDSVGLPHASVEVFNTESDAERAENEYRFDANLLHVNADLMVETFGRLGPQVMDRRYTVAYLLWELPQCPREWTAALDLVDEVWVPSRFVHEAFAPISPVPVVHLPYAVDVSEVTQVDRGEFGLPADRFLFLVSFDVGSFVARKNPRAALEAFRRAFDAGDRTVGLVLKTVNADPEQEDWRALLEEVAADPRLFLVDEMLDRDRLLGLVQTCDAYVSLHRSEGFGRGPAEAMALGKPVVVTDFSGNRDYADETNACVVGYRLVAVKEGQYPGWQGQVWAEPDVEEAAQHMRRLVESPSLSRHLAREGRRTIRAYYNPKQVGRRISARLHTLGLIP